MKSIIKSYVLGGLVVSAGLLASIDKATAQSNLQMQAENLPQNMFVNPALVPQKSFMSIPLLSGALSFDAQMPISYSSVIDQKGGAKYLDSKSIVRLLSGKNNLMVRYNLDLMNFGIKLSHLDYLNVSLRLRVHTGNQVPGGLFEMILDNPLESYNRNFGMPLSTNTLAWGELGGSYARKIDNNFSVGMRLKFIMGLGAVVTDDFGLDAYKTIDSYLVSGRGSIRGGNLNLSDIGNTGSSTFNGMASNLGFGIDIGAAYLSDDRKWNASVSISDFGAIFWNANSSSQIRVSDPNKQFNYSGIDNITDAAQNGGLGQTVETLKNDLLNTIGLDSLSGVGFTSYLPTTFQAMAGYSIDTEMRHNVSLGFMGTMAYSNMLAYSISAGYTYRAPNKHWQFMGNYTYKSNDPFCIGVGAVYSDRVFQAYLMSDNVIPFFSVLHARGVNLRLGFNFFLGNKKHTSRYYY